jgi:hydrogenase/urease accessory protein HupE
MTRALRVVGCTLLATVLIALAGDPLWAHEVRPGYLELRESAHAEFEVLWKTPRVGEARLGLVPRFSGEVDAISQVTTRMFPAAVVQEWTLRATELRGQTVHIEGLRSTLTDVLLRIVFADGTSWTHRLTPRHPEAVIPLAESGLAVAATYLELGVEHILTGSDHLLFILALVLMTHGWWKLLSTVTAFTLAHGITFSAAMLGLVHIPQQPVEAIIALSIVFVAAELLRARRGNMGLGMRCPWIVAFTFGLLHGLGFAGALGEVGLPQGHIPVALLFFSGGVELGHFLVIGIALLSSAVALRLKAFIPGWMHAVPAYGIGSVASVWVVQRVAAF